MTNRYLLLSSRSLALSALVVGACTSLGHAAALFTGSIDPSDPSYRREENDGSGLVATTDTKKLDCHYDTYSFTADAIGPYSLVVTYGGSFQGTLNLYTSFNASNASTNLVAGDAGPYLLFSPINYSAIPSDEAYGPGVSGSVIFVYGGSTTVRTLTLTPGTTYTAVVSGYDDTQYGSYSLAVTGGSVPEPVSLSAAGLCATALLRRRRA